ncbi:hypothetical protein N9A77_00660, partial [bacterium]|nr:hypothetical protein [bacterium]
MAKKASISCIAVRTLAVSFVILLSLNSGKAFGQTNANTPAQIAASKQKHIETLAVVNGHPITRHQVSQECMRRFGEEVLESRIKKLLVLDMCKKNGVMITEGDVNN